MTGSGKELVPVKKLGRPKGSGSLYTEEIAEEILERLIDGETLVRICKFDFDGNLRDRGSFPNHATVYDWADPNDPVYRPDFGIRFARARLAQQRNWIESTIDIARTPEPGIEEVVEHSERLGVSIKRSRKDMLGHRALQIETLHKAAARLNPALWAERLQQAAPPAQDPNASAPRLIIKGGLPDDPEDGSPPAAAPEE
jgi:hypothetical protein